jgi:hypothetical protein
MRIRGRRSTTDARSFEIKPSHWRADPLPSCVRTAGPCAWSLIAHPADTMSRSTPRKYAQHVTTTRHPAISSGGQRDGRAQLRRDGSSCRPTARVPARPGRSARRPGSPARAAPDRPTRPRGPGPATRCRATIPGYGASRSAVASATCWPSRRTTGSAPASARGGRSIWPCGSRQQPGIHCPPVAEPRATAGTTGR